MTTPPDPRSGAAWRALRRYVLARDHHRCQLAYPDICRGHATAADHIIPHALGGPTTTENLQAACRPCNQHKGKHLPPLGQPSRRW